jgi:formylglycine-generating enzyme required for sulfatase activity
MAKELVSPAIPKKLSSIKFPRNRLGLLVGGIFIVFALWLGLPLIGRLFSFPTATTASTASLSPLTVTPKTLEQIQTSNTAAVDVSSTPVQLPAAFTDDKGIEMVLVPAGEFTMGLDSAQAAENCRLRGSECNPDWFANYNDKHTVLLDTFYIDKLEVTNLAYRACVDAQICEPPKDNASATHEFYYVSGSPYDNFPVINLNWGMADAYCKWRGARLPTEAEWEKAARGSDGRLYPPGNVMDASRANILLSVGDATKVGSYPSGASPYGALDMEGNVSEWVADWYSEDYYQNSPASNPPGPESGTGRVIKGDSWYFERDKGYFSVGGHIGINPLSFGNHTGFRCALSVDTSLAQSAVTQTPYPYASPVISIPTPAYKEDTVYFDQDFEDMEVISGWAFQSIPRTSYPRKYWTIETQPDGNHVMVGTAPADTEISITTGSSQWTDFELDFRAKVISDPKDKDSPSFGVTVRSSSNISGNYSYELGFGRWWVLGYSKCIPGGDCSFTHLLQAEHKLITLGKWYAIEIHVYGSEIRVYVDGKLMHQITDDTSLKGGIAFNMAHEAKVYFDDIRVTKLVAR